MKKFLATALSCAMLMSMGTVGFSAAETINQSGETGSTKVTVDIASAKFKATVPTVLPIHVDSENVVTVATDARIANASSGPVEVKNARVEGVNGWSIVPFSTNFKKVPVNAKQYGMIINNSEVATTGNVAIGGFDVIPGGETIPVTYDANVAVQSDPIKDYNIGKVVFTVGWAAPVTYYSDMAAFAADITNGVNTSGLTTAASDSAIAMSAENGVIRVKLLKDLPDAPELDLRNLNAVVHFDLNGYTVNLGNNSWRLTDNASVSNGTIHNKGERGAIYVGKKNSYTDRVSLDNLSVITHVDNSAVDSASSILSVYLSSDNVYVSNVNIETQVDNTETANTPWILPLWIRTNNGVVEDTTINSTGGKTTSTTTATYYSALYVSMLPYDGDTNLKIKNFNFTPDVYPADGTYGMILSAPTTSRTVDIEDCTIDLRSAQGFTSGDGMSIYEKNDVTISNSTIAGFAYPAGESDSLGVGIYVYGETEKAKLTINEDKGPVYVYGGNNGIQTNGLVDITLNGGTYCSPNHGGLYECSAEGSTITIDGARLYNTQTAGEESYIWNNDGIIPYGGTYLSGYAVTRITNSRVEGGTHGIRLRAGGAAGAAEYEKHPICYLENTFVSGTSDAFSLLVGEMYLGKGVTTSYTTQEYQINPDHGAVLYDNR